MPILGFSWGLRPDTVFGVLLDVKLVRELIVELVVELVVDILVATGVVPEEMAEAGLVEVSFDLTSFRTFKNIIVVVVLVELTDHKIEAAMVAVGSIAIYNTV